MLESRLRLILGALDFWYWGCRVDIFEVLNANVVVSYRIIGT